MISVFLMMIAVLLGSARRGTFHSSLYRDREASRYLGEAALAEMQARLRAQPDWQEDLVDQPSLFGEGRYTVIFSASESVNNLEGAQPEPGPYGDVAPGTVFLRIHTDVDGYRQTFDVVLGRGLAAPNEGDAVIATGRVRMRGDVLITGTASYQDGTVVDANLVSNSVTDADGLVTWAPNPADPASSALIEGSVEVPGSNPQTVQMAGATITEGVDRLTAPKPANDVDILGEIARNSSLPPLPPLVSGQPVPPGDYYVSGDLDLPGDLVLDGVKLYVAGDVKVNGSIRGDGSVFVGGSTQFRGAAELLPQGEQSIALMSHGNVELTGFDGSSYMDTVTAGAGPEWAATWQYTKRDMKAILAEVEAPGYVFDPESAADYRMRLLGHEHTPDASPDNPGDPLESNKLRRLINLLEQQPASETRDFMLSKMRFLRNDQVDSNVNAGGVFGFARKSYHPDAWDQCLMASLRELFSGDSHDALFDTVNDALAHDPPLDFSEFGGPDALRGLLVSGLRAFNMDQPGSAYFQGRVLTHGWFYAGHEVSVVGSVSVLGHPSHLQDPNWQATPPSAPGLTLAPGDLQLDGGTKVTYMQDVVDSAGSGPGVLGVQYWLGH